MNELTECMKAPMEQARPTMTENLRNTKLKLERELSEVNAAIKALEAAPQVADALDKIARLNLRW